MKLFHRIIPFLAALPLLAAAWSCNRHSDDSEQHREIAQLKEELKSQLSEINSDSLASRTVWIAPEVKVSSGDDLMDEDTWPFIVGIVGIIFGCAVPVAIVAVIMSSVNTRRRYEMRVVEMAISRNYPLPNDFYRSVSNNRRLYRAIIWMGIGIGCWAMAIFSDNEDMAWIGVFPFFIGLANLALFLIRRHDEKKKEQSAAAEEEAELRRVHNPYETTAPESNRFSAPAPTGADEPTDYPTNQR